MMKGISATEKTDEGLNINSVFMMADSGARGSAAQMKQLAGMRGLIAKPSGEIIESPITSNFKEGLTALEYFNSTHGARKGLADTALKTANSGYLTRRLCDVAQDLTITKKDCDCKSKGSITLSEIIEGGNIIVSLSERALGRVVADNVKNPISGEVIIKKGEMIDEAGCEKIDAAGVKAINVYSVITCGSKEGVCAMSYGRDLSRGQMVNVGEAIGMISAQSIGEPGTQLTMRTFHVGGTAQIKQDSQIVVKNDGILKIINTNLLEDSKKNQIVMGRNTQISLEDEKGMQIAIYKVPYGSKLFYQNGENCNSTLNGLTIINANQHVDHYTFVSHAQPNCESHQEYKGIFSDKSVGVFNGKILVDKIAQKTNAFQQNNNILLEDKSTVNSKPQLEIFADDVKCSHGCTIGQLDQDALFYLRTRGIPKKEAEALLTYAFANNILESVEIPELKTKIKKIIAKKLGLNLGFNL